MVGGWGSKDKPYFDNVSLIDSASFQVSCRFPDLIIKSSLVLVSVVCLVGFFISCLSSAFFLPNMSKSSFPSFDQVNVKGT